MQVFNNIKYVWKKYNFLLRQLVSRDFKVKYKRSVLGVLWSLLYPLLTMAVMAIVFTNVFKFTTPGVNYLSYLMSGLVIFNYFSEASNLAMSSVVANFSLINKVYMPKYIFPLSKCVFVGINFLLSQIPLYVILIATGTGINWYHIFLPYAYLCLFLFTLGFGLILSTVSVFLRDMFYIYGVVISLWTYMTPIMYDIAIIDKPALLLVFKCNPLYWIIYFARRIMLYNTIPEINSWIYCMVFGLGTLLIGIFVFKKNQDKFIYYV
ncbi:MAG: ABC transporter permease [Ruminococcaceae bacterium]|nr:ABC transporter permease [Oscillospiraceae bacterium]